MLTRLRAAPLKASYLTAARSPVVGRLPLGAAVPLPLVVGRLPLGAVPLPLVVVPVPPVVGRLPPPPQGFTTPAIGSMTLMGAYSTFPSTRLDIRTLPSPVAIPT